MRYSKSLTPAEIRALLRCNPDTGDLIWLKRDNPAFNTRYAGTIAGHLNRLGYREVRINNQLHREHRIVWVLHYGRWPEQNLDHIDGNPQNNAISNLRECNQVENSQNTRLNKRNSSGYTGVAYSRVSNCWRAQICHQRKIKHLGLFRTKEEANAAYLAAKSELHKFNPTHRERRQPHG